MTKTDFALCPSCKSKTWHDMLAWGDEENSMRFRCVRCGRIIKISECRKCKGKNWERLNEVDEKGARLPVVRYRCRKCGRVIGLYLDA